MQSSREPHFKAAIHVLKYLKSDPTLGLFLSNAQTYDLKAHCDSDWASCPDSSKSFSGYLVLLGDCTISWKSKKQETVSLSFAEAEYRSIRNVVGELVWLRRLLIELTIPYTESFEGEALDLTVSCNCQFGAKDDSAQLYVRHHEEASTK
uniref:Reverse transcriptase Ty1/copia-type domain-containing protein n=1 Tax=Solanum lycopersicum TaxID=4081 RepID=A0A3Q7JCG5_SOLLC